MLFKDKPEGFEPLFELVSCFFEHDGEVLLLHRHDHKSQGGRWGLPAGKVDAGESLEDAMVREIHEETSHRLLPEDVLCFSKVYVEHPEHKLI